MTDTPAISIPTENESSDTTALVSEPDSVCRKSAGGALVARGKNAGQIIVSDESGSKQLVPYQGTQGGSLVVRPAPVKGEVVPYEKKQYLPAVIPRLGDLDAYIRYANAAPILSAEEEHALAVRLRDEGDLMAAQQLILSHLRERDLLKLAASVEVKSEHPLAQAIVRCARENETGLFEAKDFSQQPGSVFAMINGKTYAIGNRTLVKDDASILSELETLSEAGKTALVVCEDNVPVGIVVCADTIKSDSAEAIRAFKAAGLRVMMLTGDNERTAKAIARAVGIDEVVSEVLPADKAAVVKQTQQQGVRVLMIGDGINDAPALATADVGMAIGAGTDVAIECADVVLVNSKLTDAVSAYELSCAVLRNIKQNLFWAFFYNAIGIPVAAGVFFTTLGWSLNPMIGAAAMSMSSVCVVTNALRLRRFKPTNKNSLSSFSTVAAAYAAYQLPLEQRSKTMQKVISIEGMHCPHCSGAVTKALTKLAGVTSVDVSLEKKCAVIECEETVTDDVLKATITDLDFEVTGIETK